MKRISAITWFGSLLLLGVCLGHMPARAQDAVPQRVSFVGDIWCPYNCDPADAQQGALVDLLKAVLARRGITLEYRVLPWTRALQEVSEGRIDGIIGAGVADGKHAALTEKAWLQAELAVLAHRDSQFQWQGLASLAGKSVVVIANYEYASPLPAWLAANPTAVHQLSGDNAFRQAVMLVQHKRQDIFFSSYPALRRHIAASQTPNDFLVVRTGLKTPIFMGVTRAKPYSAELKQILDSGFDAITASGKAATLIARYEL